MAAVEAKRTAAQEKRAESAPMMQQTLDEAKRRFENEVESIKRQYNEADAVLDAEIKKLDEELTELKTHYTELALKLQNAQVACSAKSTLAQETGVQIGCVQLNSSATVGNAQGGARFVGLDKHGEPQLGQHIPSALVVPSFTRGHFG